jgi:tRNA threonylcarbamoyl adenosine modification protein (Sua5/YciO/YrdC/YwlC family)
LSSNLVSLSKFAAYFKKMLIELRPHSIDQRKVNDLVKILKNGGVVVFPTDSVYCFGCDLMNKKGLEKMAQLKGLKLNKANFSLICHDFSSLSEYTKPFDRMIFKAMNRSLPGPFTFILTASNQVPKLFDSNKKEIGIRIPNNEITIEIVKQLGNPIAVTSVHDEDEIIEYTTDPYEIFERFEKKVDAVIDGGISNLEPTTIVDCTSGEIQIIREGAGDVNLVV